LFCFVFGIGNGELKEIVYKHIPDKVNSRILIVGTGTSTFPLRMCENGYHHVHGTDYVDAVIEKMSKQSKEIFQNEKKSNSPQPTWDVMDATEMTCNDESYHAILDKGCLDAMLIPPGSTGKTITGSTWVDSIEESTMAMVRNWKKW